MERFDVPAMLAWGSAMLDWPVVGPGDFHCPVLWLVGSEDGLALENARGYEPSLRDSPVQLQILEGLNHSQVFDEIDLVFPTMLDFTRSKETG